MIRYEKNFIIFQTPLNSKEIDMILVAAPETEMPNITKAAFDINANGFARLTFDTRLLYGPLTAKEKIARRDAIRTRVEFAGRIRSEYPNARILVMGTGWETISDPVIDAARFVVRETGVVSVLLLVAKQLKSPNFLEIDLFGYAPESGIYLVDHCHKLLVTSMWRHALSVSFGEQVRADILQSA
jgi:hypothetical protein